MNKKLKIFLIILGVALLAAAAGAAAFTRVRTGSRLNCKYNHLIKEDISWKIVPRWEAKDYGIRETTTTCAKHKALEKKRSEALAKLKNGDTAAAKKLFEEIKAVDPTFQDINTQLDRIDEAQNANPPGTTPPPVTPPKPVDLAGLLTGSLTGYTAGKLDTGDSFASRVYQPKSRARMQSLLATVHEAGTLAGAEQFIARVDKVGFPKDSKDTAVNGYAAYFGTDGTTYATLAWAKGSVAYELQAHSSTASPADLEAELLALAASFNK